MRFAISKRNNRVQMCLLKLSCLSNITQNTEQVNYRWKLRDKSILNWSDHWSTVYLNT